MREVYVIGVGLHAFGRFADKEVIEIGREAVVSALDDAGIGWNRVQSAYCGTVFAGPMAGNKVLARVGFKDIYQLHGGYRAWKDAGLPVEK